jgi:hypothetical protein
VPAGKFVKAIVGLVLLLWLVIMAISIWVSFSIQNPAFAVIMAAPTAFLLVLYGNYRGIQIRIDAQELVVHYGVLNRKHVQLADIATCEPTKADFGKYWGVGVRFGTDRSYAYTTSFGNAVKVVLKKGRPFVFSSHHPQEICDIITQTKTTTLPNDST